MPLPNITIIYGQGGIGTTTATEDNIAAIIVSGVAVSGKFALGEVFSVFSLSEAEEKGITEAYDTTNVTTAHKNIKDFYQQAGEGAELFIMVVANTVTLTQMADLTNNYAKTILASGQGRIKLLAISRSPDIAYSPTITAGIDPDVITAVTKAQELVEQEQAYYRPVQILVEGRAFDGNPSTLHNLRQGTQNRVSVVLGNDTPLKQTLIGLALGTLAKLPVQVNLGAVKNGELGLVNVYLTNTAHINTFNESQLGVINDKGYIFPRKHVGLNGYFWVDDNTSTALTDDYAYISRGRTIDKVFRIVRTTYLTDLLNDILIDEETGKIPAVILKSFQAKVERAIDTQMTANAEISGVSAFIDPTQDIISTNEIKIRVDIIPVGYARKFTITIGFINPNLA